MKTNIETMNKNQVERKNTISEMNTLEGTKSRLDEAENQISKVEDKVEINTHSKKMEKTQKE